MAEPVVAVEGLWKHYGSPLRELLRSVVGRAPAEDGPWALRDVGFELGRGETLGLIGRNGAGKSTLLKILAGVSPPTWGRVVVRGRIFPMIELNAGIQPDLSGAENALLLGSLMGLSRREMRASLASIQRYSELGAWFERPVRTYSTGMLARLGFSVAIHVEADLLLIDEVLAVGDASFQKKCLRSVEAAIARGASVVFVSHSPYTIERVCERALLLEGGALLAAGPASEVMTEYFCRLARAPAATAEPGDASRADPAPRAGSGELRIERVTLLDPERLVPLDALPTGADLWLQLDLLVREPDLAVNLAVRIYDAFNTLVVNLIAPREVCRAIACGTPKRLRCELPRLPLLPGAYVVDVVCKEAGRLVDHLPNAARFAVSASPRVAEETANAGLVHLPAAWRAEPGP